jgi:hypothetical protein
MGKIYRTVSHRKFFCPEELRQHYEAEGYTILGSTFRHPGGGCYFRVVSAPFCRLYLDKGRLTPDVNETLWVKEGRKWREYRSAFLSYLVQYLSCREFPAREMTIRWRYPELAS